eukprot:363732-Chlamydomonas_euryale.AAC.8
MFIYTQTTTALLHGCLSWQVICMHQGMPNRDSHQICTCARCLRQGTPMDGRPMGDADMASDAGHALAPGLAYKLLAVLHKSMCSMQA